MTSLTGEKTNGFQPICLVDHSHSHPRFLASHPPPDTGGKCSDCWNCSTHKDDSPQGGSRSTSGCPEEYAIPLPFLLTFPHPLISFSPSSRVKQTLDTLPSHLLTPSNVLAPASNLLDRIARGVADAKGPVGWPHSQRAICAKIVELAWR